MAKVTGYSERLDYMVLSEKSHEIRKIISDIYSCFIIVQNETDTPKKKSAMRKQTLSKLYEPVVLRLCCEVN